MFRDDFYLYTTTIDGAFRLFTVMEDDPSWFQLAASGSTTDIGQVQAELRGSTSVEQKMKPMHPFVASGLDENLAESLKGPSRAKRVDEEATGHDHIFWFDRRGRLSRTVLKVSPYSSGVTLHSHLLLYLRDCPGDRHVRSLSPKLWGPVNSLLCRTLIRSARHSASRPDHSVAF